MATESELKYRIESVAAGQEILKSRFIQRICVPGSSEEIQMKAVYYDDSEGLLSSNKIGYRIRKEGNRYVATVKYAALHTGDGFSRRYEYNVDVDGEEANPKIFCGVIEDKNIAKLFGDIKPEKMFTTEFVRDLVLVNYKASVIEVSFDSGSIYSEKSTSSLPICELECELKSGSEAELTDFGAALVDEFGLTALNDSKLKRGLQLIKK